jgi:hypothetical protein
METPPPLENHVDWRIMQYNDWLRDLERLCQDEKIYDCEIISYLGMSGLCKTPDEFYMQALGIISMYREHIDTAELQRCVSIA